MTNQEKKPIKLYRFEKNSPKRRKTILKNELRISAPSEFNDLDDCRITGIFRVPLTPEEYGKILEGIELFYPAEANSETELLSKEILQQLKELIILYSNPIGIIEELFIQSIINRIKEQIRTTTGACCFFGDNPDSDLMWAHYADNHKGFCIEYEADYETPGLLEVTYSSKLPAPSATELLFSPKETLGRIVTTKNMEWNYEKEWRLVFLKALSPGEKGMNIKRPDTIKPVRIITGANYNPDQKTNKKFIASMTKKFEATHLTYNNFKKQIESE